MVALNGALDDLGNVRRHLVKRVKRPLLDCVVLPLDGRVHAVDDSLERHVHLWPQKRALVRPGDDRVEREEDERLGREVRVRRRLSVGELDGGLDEREEGVSRGVLGDELREDDERAGLGSTGTEDDGVRDGGEGTEGTFRPDKESGRKSQMGHEEKRSGAARTFDRDGVGFLPVDHDERVVQPTDKLVRVGDRRVLEVRVRRGIVAIVAVAHRH